MTFICVLSGAGIPGHLPSSCSSCMEQDKHGVCEAPDSEDTGMGSDFENSEDREENPEEREMGSNAQDADKTAGCPEQDAGSSPQEDAPRGDSEEREPVSDVCAGEMRDFPRKLPRPRLFLVPPES